MQSLMDKTLHHSTNNIHENWFTAQILFSITVHTGNIGGIHNLGYWMGMEGQIISENSGLRIKYGSTHPSDMGTDD